ncbi:hypothetical protein Tco_0891087 [Tanacetum coccineum]|uniref:Uncharacterized protein n=1 Tax=Tanacetum coccineum TaxID=301880 RepID=A0ABQ5C1W9_9ASTR
MLGLFDVHWGLYIQVFHGDAIFEDSIILITENQQELFLQRHFLRELSDEQALHPIIDQSASLLVKIEAPRELPKEKVFVISALENDLRKLKGKDIVDNAAQMSNAATIAPKIYKLDRVILAPKVKNNREVHEYYLKHTIEQAAIFRERKEWKPIGKVFNSVGNKWKPTERTFTLVGNACPLTRITATNKVPLRVPIPLEVVAPEHVVTRVYTRRPKVPKSVPNSKPKVAKSMTANRMKPGTSLGSDTLVAPSSSSFIDCRWIVVNDGIFAYAILCEEVCVSQPDGFVDPDNSNHVYRPDEKTPYGLKPGSNMRGKIAYCHRFCYPKDSPKARFMPHCSSSEKLETEPCDIFRGTVYRGLWYSKDSAIALTAFADVDHAGCHDTKS